MAKDKLMNPANAKEEFTTACSRAGGTVQSGHDAAQCLTENGKISMVIDRVYNDVTVTNRPNGGNVSRIMNPDHIEQDRGEIRIEKENKSRVNHMIRVKTEGEF
jgi:hypothetical protein